MGGVAGGLRAAGKMEGASQVEGSWEGRLDLEVAHSETLAAPREGLLAVARRAVASAMVGR